MKKTLLSSILPFLILLTIADGSKCGEAGRVIGQLNHLEIECCDIYPKTVTLVNERTHIISNIEKDQSFIFPRVPPGRYFLVIGEGDIVKNEIEVEPDLSTSLTLDFSILQPGLTYPEGMHQVGDTFFNVVKKGAPSLIYYDKTFSGYVILGEEELRNRGTPFDYYNIVKKQGIKGYRWTP